MIKVITLAVAACFITSAGFAGSCCSAKKADVSKAAPYVSKTAAKDVPSTATIIAKK